MNTVELIESGLLESYCLGFSAREEQEFVRQAVAEHDGLEDYMMDLEGRIRLHFETQAVTPPPSVREILLLREPETQKIVKKKHVFNNQKAEEKKGPEYLDIEVNDTHIKVHKLWRPAFLIVFILSKIFLIAGIYYYFKSSSLEDELSRMKATNTEIHP